MDRGRGMVVGLGSRSRRGRLGADAERRDHLYCNSGSALNLSPRRARCASHFLSIYRFFFRIPFPSAFTCTYSYATKLLLIFALPFSCCLPFMFVYDGRGGGFPFYALVKYFPWFCVLLFVRILLSGFSLLAVAAETFSYAPLHSTCSIFYHRDFRFLSFDFPRLSLLFYVWAYLSTCKT